MAHPKQTANECGQARSGMQSTHTIHTQSLGHRTQLGKGEKRREGDLYLITVWMLAMNQKICFVPRFVRAAVRWTRTRPRTWGDGQTAKNARRTGAAAVHFTSLSLLFSAIYFCLSPLSLSSSLSALSAVWKEEKSARERRQRFAGDIGHNK